VETAEQAEAAVRAVRYAPRGNRSWGPFGAKFYGPDYEDQADKEIFLAVQIESQLAVDNSEEIMAVDGIDGCWIGPNDLRKSMGVDPSTKKGAEAHEAAILRLLEVCRKTNKIPGIYGGGHFESAGRGNAQHRIEQGFLFVVVGGDDEFVRTGAPDSVETRTVTVNESRVIFDFVWLSRKTKHYMMSGLERSQRAFCSALAPDGKIV